MSGSVVADFVAEAIYADVHGDEPTQARILLSEDQLVIASQAGRTAVDLEDVFDVVVSKIPEDLGGFFDQSVLVAYATDDERRTALVRGEHDRIDRFALFLLKAILRDAPADVRHPVREGGRVLDPDPRAASVVPTRDAVRFRSDEGDVAIRLDDVVAIDYRRRSVDGAGRPALSVRHRDGDAVVTTEVHHDSANRLNVLARHLRSEYYRADELLSEIDVDDTEKRALVALYAGVAPESLDRVIGAEEDTDPGTVGRYGDDGSDVDPDAVLSALVEKGLVADPDSGALTHDGALVAIHRIEDVAD